MKSHKMIFKLRADAGALYIDALISFAVFITLIFSFITVPEVLIKKQELDYIAKTVVRRIERDGMAGGAVYQTVHELNSETGVVSYVTWNGAFRGADSKIQIRDRFTVTARCVVKIKLIDPAFAEPVFIEVPLQKTLSGVSEVYWKELA